MQSANRRAALRSLGAVVNQFPGFSVALALRDQPLDLFFEGAHEPVYLIEPALPLPLPGVALSLPRGQLSLIHATKLTWLLP